MNIPGISEVLRAQFSEVELARLFGPHAHRGDVHVWYERPNGDRVGPLPSSRHAAWVAKGLTAVALPDTPAPAPIEPLDVPKIAEHATDDRRAVYFRNDERAIFSLKAHAALTVKGWTFERFESEREAYIDSRKGRPLSREEAAIAAGLPHD